MWNRRKNKWQKIKLTISFGDDAACMNQSCVRKSLMGFFSVDAECGHCVPGKRRINPLVEPKYCQESAASRSKLFANIGSKCADHATADCTFESKIFFVFFFAQTNELLISMNEI